MTHHDDRDRTGIFASTVTRPVALMVVFVTLIVVGVIAYSRIPLQLLPSNFTEPEVNIWVPHSDSSAQENEEQVARVIEEQLRTLTGIEEMESWSDSDSVFFDIDFDGQMDMDLAKAEVRDRLERARPLLPSTAENPGMWTESASSLPITFFGILLKGDPATRDHLMEEVIVPRLEAVDGVARVTVWGMLQDSVRILLDEDKVTAAQLDIGAVIRRLMADNFAQPLGEVTDGGREVILRSDMRFKNIAEIEEFPVGNGLKLKDVGRVARVKSVADQLSRIDGAIAYYGMASKDSQANVVQSSRNWEQALKDLEADPALEGRMSYMLLFLQGQMIEDALGQLEETALWGGLLAVAVLFIFLRRVRLTLCVALSIPVSALLAIAFEYFIGGSFNVLTMTGITLAIGMLVDNAVVVVENIARVHRSGEPRLRAAAIGTRQIALAVTLATMTTVVVFLPLIFMTTNAQLRSIFAGLGIPLSVALLASLLVAVVFLPVISGRLLSDKTDSELRTTRILDAILFVPVRAVALAAGAARLMFYCFLWTVHRINRAVLFVASPLRWVIALGVIALAWTQWDRLSGVVGAGSGLDQFGVSLGGGPDAGQALLIFGVAVPAALFVVVAIFGLRRWRLRPSAPPARPEHFVPQGTSLVGMLVESNQRLVAWTMRYRFWACLLAFLAFFSVVIPRSQTEMSPFGQDSRADSVDFGVNFNADFSLSEAADEIGVYEDFLESKREEWGYEHWSSRFDEDQGWLTLYWDGRRTNTFYEEMEETVREELPQVAGHSLIFYDEENTSANSVSVARFTLMGPDSAELEALGEEAKRLLETVPGLSQVNTPLESSPDQINVRVDRDLAQELGVNADAVQQSLNWALRGFALPRFQEKGREVPFLIEFDEEKVAGLSTLRDLSVFTENSVVALSSIADLEFDKGSRRIYRRNGQTSFTLTAQVEDPLRVIAITEAGYRALGQLELPRGYSIDRGDSALDRQMEEFDELFKALILSIVLVFLLMGILFESVLLPFSVLFTVPFAYMGAMWTLYMTGTNMDSMGYIGNIILAGVVVNNGIVLVDRIHQLRRDGLARAKAIMEGCAQRVRPVLMTALTTVCGLLPMILTEPPSNNSIDYRTLATIVAGGLVASTFFTLWVVPLAYSVLDDLREVVRARLRWWISLPARLALRARRT